MAVLFTGITLDNPRADGQGSEQLLNCLFNCTSSYEYIQVDLVMGCESFDSK
jgi:hypothetical protein